MLELNHKRFKGQNMTDKGYGELRKLQQKYVEDVSITMMNIDDKVMLAPTIKAYWTEKLYAHRHQLDVLEKKMEKLRHNEKLIIEKSMKVRLSEAEIKRLRLRNNEDIEKCQDGIDDLKEIISNLREYQKLSAFYGNDIKNVLDYMKLNA